MGRNKKYKTEMEKHDAEKRWKREYYYRNKEKFNSKNSQSCNEFKK